MENETAQSSSWNQFYSVEFPVGSEDESVDCWYAKTLSGVPEDARQLLKNYSRIPPEAVDSHVLSMRDKAWGIFPYPCVGQFRFLNLSLHKWPYVSTLEHVKKGAKLLDLGCCLGQDIRKLVADGAPAENFYGAELEKQFIELSYDFFHDRQTLKAKLMQADALDVSHGSPLGELMGTINYIHLAMVVHVFGLEEQQLLLENCIKILKPAPGSVIFGTTVGDVEGTAGLDGSFMHSAETFEKLWEDVAARTGVNLDCRVFVDDILSIPAAQKKSGFGRARRLVFEVERR